MAHSDSINSAFALHRPVIHGEYHRIPPAQRHHLGTRLRARPLLGQHELAALEVGSG